MKNCQQTKLTAAWSAVEGSGSSHFETMRTPHLWQACRRKQESGSLPAYFTWLLHICRKLSGQHLSKPWLARGASSWLARHQTCGQVAASAWLFGVAERSRSSAVSAFTLQHVIFCQLSASAQQDRKNSLQRPWRPPCPRWPFPATRCRDSHLTRLACVPAKAERGSHRSARISRYTSPTSSYFSCTAPANCG